MSQIGDEKNGCKITVLKRTIHQDLFEEFRGEQGDLCQAFIEGQEFIIEDTSFTPPEGFCPWAWADIRHYLQGIHGGLQYSGKDVFVACCTDGFRPVLFKLERFK